jgi:hypothetical protein
LLEVGEFQMIAHRLMSLTVLAMLTFAPTITSASAQNSALTPDLLSKMLGLIARKGTDRPIAAPIANALGLSATGQEWESRQVSGPDSRPGAHHGFALSRGTEKDIALSLLTPDILHAFRARRDGTIVAALTLDLRTGQLIMLSHAEAQKELDAEFAYWTSAFNTAK